MKVAKGLLAIDQNSCQVFTAFRQAMWLNIHKHILGRSVSDEELQRRSETAFSELYISLGRCTARLQFVELALTQLLAVISVTDKIGDDATPRRLRLDTAQQGFRRKTLGQLVGEIQNLSASPSSPLTDEFREQVRQLNKKRIWAIHSCTDEIDEQIVDDVVEVDLI